MPRMPVARRMVMGRSFVPGPLGVLKVLFAVVYRRDMRPSYVPSMPYGRPHVCPRCGERVSAFAAGCALCGADLDPRRAQRGRPPGARGAGGGGVPRGGGGVLGA